MNIIKKYSFTVLMVVLTAILLLVSVIHLQGVYSKYEIENNYQLKNSVELKYEVLQKEFKELKDDIFFLSDLYTKLDKPELQDVIENFSSKHPLYGQIRYLDTNGQELLRVDNKKGRVVVVKKEYLQDKSNRYYFQDSVHLKEGELYLSPFDLNVENGKIETPHNPTLRVLTPIYKNGQKIANVIINYSGETLLNRVKAIDSGSIKTSFVNQNGYYLIAEDKKKEWSFMFDKRDRLQKENREFYKQIIETKEGIYEDGINLYFYKEIYPKNIINIKQKFVQKWIILSYIKRDYISEQFYNYLNGFLYVLLFFILIIVIGSYLISKYIRRIGMYEKEVAFQSRKIAELKRINSLGDMINNIAHQWRQPLSAIRMETNNLEVSMAFGENIEDDTLSKALQDIDQHTQYLTDTIDELTELFTLDNEKAVSLEVKDLITQSLKGFENEMQNNNIEVVLDIQDFQISGKKQQLIQALISLYSNAIEAMVTNCELDDRYLLITTKMKNKSFLTITIQDSGGGIAKEIVDKIFEPYFTTKHKAQGVGVSLYLTYQIVVIGHNGYITTKNREFNESSKNLKGAQFIISLPIE